MEQQLISKTRRTSEDFSDQFSIALRTLVERIDLIEPESMQNYGVVDKFNHNNTQPFNRSDWIDSIFCHQNIIVGDFHTYAPCQRFFTELLQNVSCTKNTGELKIAVCLEMIQPKDIPDVRRYERGEITFQQLVSQLNFESKWSFKWTQYKKIFELSKKFGFGIHPIEHDSDKVNRRERDQFAAEKMSHLLSQDYDFILTLIGEKHLGEDGFLNYLQQNEKKQTARVFVDHESFSSHITSQNTQCYPKYFKGEEKAVYGVLRHPGWLKWISLLEWEAWLDDRDNNLKGCASRGIDLSRIDIDSVFNVLLKTSLETTRCANPNFSNHPSSVQLNIDSIQNPKTPPFLKSYDVGSLFGSLIAYLNSRPGTQASSQTLREIYPQEDWFRRNCLKKT